MNTVKATIGSDKYKTTVIAGKNNIIVDEPTEKGGLDLGFQPLELLASSLASCTAITLKMYTDHKQWAIEKFHVAVTVEQSEDKKETKLIRKISYEGNIDEKQQVRLEAVANTCPIHKILHSQISVETIIL
ncbi:osmotically inducible protein OsmC [Sphingobacterium sp. ML3W]|uniref:OsmC family protein n=1 Tax=Sphingobacterium sp. ML3W TaxID=1538644 RepID=UPI0004F66B8D|nr:OsmC family protein [Sphingobacterium sp. ML3W]AIM38194.1 osmotically inducible protein OsmC [Sphingobacterium sp. ML3W]